MTEDELFMTEALREAERAESNGDVPVGAVVVRGAAIIGRGCNEREWLHDPTAHAEVQALRAASSAIGGWRLAGTTVYATMEPCPMCAGALVNARVARVVWACDDPKAGAVKTAFGIGTSPLLNHRFEIESGVLGDAAAQLLKRFFKARRSG